MILRGGFLALALLVCSGVAAADWITTGGESTFDDGLGDLPPGGLTGWFFNPDAGLPSPVETDPGQPWTSAANIETLNYWLSEVALLGDDPSLLYELYGLGMITAPNVAGLAATQTEVNDLLEEYGGQPDPSGIPEPATASFLAGALVFLGIYAAIRTWRMRRVHARHGTDASGITCKDGPP